MPTIIALDVSLSMTRPIPNSSTGGTAVVPENTLTYHQVAMQGINSILDYLSKHARLEFVSLIVYSSLYEMVVDFTRDYDTIRAALHKIEHYDKTSLESVLVAVNNAFRTQWGSENYCQLICITDCGVGMGPSSLKNTIINIQNWKAQCGGAGTALPASVVDTNGTTDSGKGGTAPQPPDNLWVGFAYPCKLSFMCLGSLATDSAFRYGTKLYQQLLDVSGQRGQLFFPRVKHDESLDESALGDATSEQASVGCDDAGGTSHQQQQQQQRQIMTRTSVLEMFDAMCDTNYRAFDATLRCGSYFRLEGPIVVWPAPLPYTARDVLGSETTKLMSRHLEVCGFLALADIGSPMSISRHLILPRHATVTSSATDDGTKQGTAKLPGGKNGHQHHPHGSLSTAEERLETDIKAFYGKSESGALSGDHHHHGHHDHADEGATADVNKESVCVLLHGALKVENMAALVLLGDGWYGFIYSYADGKKKSNLMLNVLPPGNDVVPWLGDLRYLGTLEDAFPGENPSFPIKVDKRSYSQNIVVWIRQAGLQSDIQKVLRHAKKLPEKTQHFYKELNRIRRAALSLGFVELLEGLAHIFEREINTLPMSASPDCALQLAHASIELRKQSNRDPKTIIHAVPTQYNQLG
ncbi:integrator complex subunit 14 [Anopheles bellator]|uniref:integrator complex subunit 14 n=1 Tax=Anopheles bellator TaxID=139047 RepID=UPI002647CD86|nr:integrator complex subunit 14 [Anopheles bellator]